MATHAASTRNISGLARALAQHGLMTEYEAETLQTQAQQAGVSFVWHENISGTPNPAFRKIDIAVADAAQPDYALAQLSGYLGQTSAP